MIDNNKVIEYIKNSSQESAVYVGCDSTMKWNIKKKFLQPIYVIAIVIHIDQCKGAKVFHEIIRGEKLFGDKIAVLRQRLLQEVYYSCEVGVELKEAVGDRKYEIHLDLNEDYKWASSKVVNEAKGIVKAYDLTPIVKPNALAASSVADKVAVAIREDERNPLTR